MRKIIKTALGISVAVLAFTVFGMQTNHVHAIESSGISALPAHPRFDNPRTKSIFVYDINVDEVITDGIKVMNNTDSTKTLAVYPVDSQSSSDGAFACAQQVEPRKEVGNWIKLEQNEVTLPAGGSKIIPFTIKIPAGSPAGEHNGCIVVQDVAAVPKGQGVVLSFRSALRVAVTTPGALRADLSFVDIKSRDINQTTLGVSPTLKNEGNVSANPQLTVQVSGIFFFEHPFSSTQGTFPVFPGTESRFNFEVKKPFLGGWYRVTAQATYQKPLPSGELSDDVTTVKAKEAIIFITPQPEAIAIEAAGLVVVVGLVVYVVRRMSLLRRLRLMPTQEYVVQDGETINSVADKLNMKWKHLAKINNLKSPYAISAGQVIKVPEPAAKTPGSAQSKPEETKKQPPSTP